MNESVVRPERFCTAYLVEGLGCVIRFSTGLPLIATKTNHRVTNDVSVDHSTRSVVLATYDYRMNADSAGKYK